MTASWPTSLWDSPLLRDLDPAMRDQLAAAARVVELTPAAAAYREGDHSDTFFLVAAGCVALRAVRRGDQADSVLRLVRAGDSFGEEALLDGLRRRATACAVEAARVVEVPIALFRRLAGRGGGARDLERERRYLERAAARDLLAASALGRELGDDDRELLLDGARMERHPRGACLFEPGDRADRCFVLVDGLVQIQREDGGRTSVIAYLARGDLFGDEEALAGAPRDATALATGDSWCASVTADALRTVSDRNPGLVGRLRRIAHRQRADQGELLAAASARSTQHVFRDLYRMQVARSLLVIDQDRCVRCGHCAWSCEQVHGVSRLVRRGDKVVTRLDAGQPGPASLLLPNTCQHCRHAACMIDCPTGAIGRDPEGEVFIRPELCTGCGNCAKACPWDNIQLAPRPSGTGGAAAPSAGLSAEVAVKCDLCRGYEAPACIEACPTEAIARIDPARDIAEVAGVLGLPMPGGGTETGSVWGTGSRTGTGIGRPGIGRTGVGDRDRDRDRNAVAIGIAIGDRNGTGMGMGATIGRGPAPLLLAGSAAATIVVGALGWGMQASSAWVPGRGPGLAMGLLGGMLIAALAAYAAPKRLVRRAMRRRPAGARAALVGDRPVPRSRMRPHLVAHLVAGALAPACVLAHTGARLPASPGGALLVALALTTSLGVAGALFYRALPRLLTRLERRGALPEDLAGERDALAARLYREISGTGEAVKAAAAHIVLPYARARLGGLALALSGRSLVDEEARMRRRIDDAVAGRGTRLDGLQPILRTAVELRALTARRLLTAALRAWLPLHMVAGAVVLVLLVLHALVALLF